ncbi:sulfatase [Leptospira levettii]|uniref:Sulfatase-like hydrolase/transferase n=1 Tax=Leptospira levettii TaxID=2023178 RepID=A0AAW5V592_9LEPT|nr:sulfatase [Leptospira levettii]MCW7465742.1 sulfatase-like hydrolase/transferase [Leptospira levettii]MCW7510480.1 sulfatase-like hydrolase/transferase [Leptospira levettii]MCW7514233.1 sulfatase-like hydrolase/transferase [Leptospira levettii]
MRKILTFAPILCFCLIQCLNKSESRFPVDLVLELKNAKPKFKIGTDNRTYHWKKNPGRQSGLPLSRKWENTQITFNTNKEIFLNHSLDSIYFPPGQEYQFTLPKGRYKFSSLVGLLGEKEFQPNVSGKLKLYTQSQFLEEWDFTGTTKEQWNKKETFVTLEGDLRLVWESKDSDLYIGEPLLYPKEWLDKLIPTQKPKSVILIVVDSARKDFIGAYGFRHSVTPNIDQMAKESVFFENPFANGNWTKPSMMSFFHSEYSSNLGLGNSWFSTKPYQRKVYYGKKRDNLAKTFRESGYYSKTIMNNVFFLDYTTVGLDLGFHNSYQVGMDIVDTEVLTNHAIEFVTEKKDIPYFLHFNLNTPHASYSPPPEDMKVVRSIIPDSEFFRYESPVQRYLGEMHYTDREIGRLVKKLKELGTYDETMIIVTGDHGELFSPEHDYSYHFIMQTRFGHGETHYDEEINVPYFIKLPKSIADNIGNNNQIRIPGQSSLLSLAPTILGFLDLLPKNSTYQGVDYASCIRNASPCPKETYIYTEGRMSESVRTEKYKYIRRYPGFTTVRRTSAGEPHTMTEELYDLKQDPKELRNLSLEAEGETLLQQARADFRRENFLKRNGLRIWIPPCEQTVCRDTMSMSVQGSIYDWIAPPTVQIASGSAKTISVSKESNDRKVPLGSREPKQHLPAEIILKTVNPELGAFFQFTRNGKTIPVRFGKYGLEFQSSMTHIEDLIVSERQPDGLYESPLPWVYNDGAFSGSGESEVQKEMGKEVKKILETWGYIHE